MNSFDMIPDSERRPAVGWTRSRIFIIIAIILFVQLLCLALYLLFANNAVRIENDDCADLADVVTKYPLTDPTPDAKYRIGIIADLDSGSKSQNETNTWHSYFRRGYLKYDRAYDNVTVEWDRENATKTFKSKLSVNGRGLELSELVTFDGKLLTVDDKSGLVYVIENDKLVPWVILVDGDGHQEGGMKNEWATVKDSRLYVGSHGTEWGNSQNPMWVKVVDKSGGVRHSNWTDNYIKVRAAFNVHFPGYMVHESCVWSDVHGRWFFLPRKASMEAYDDKTDPRKATNVLLSVSPDFNDIKVVRVGETIPDNTHGYNSFKFIPGTKDTVIAATKASEVGDVSETFITVFTVDGKIIYPETKVADLKFEGFEFI